jgi:hypothetical protein
MIGLNLRTAKDIIILSRPQKGKPKLIDCKNAIKAKTYRKNFKEIYDLLLPYISDEKKMSDLKNESFIRDGVASKISRVANKTKNIIDAQRQALSNKLQKNLSRAGDNIYIPGE